jgi:diguanylate cyclase (GGDEF)-like protein
MTVNSALLQLEDQIRWEPMSCLAQAIELERRAGDDELLVMRARLVQANMRLRAGEVAAAARQVWDVYDWAREHAAGPLIARTHLVLANVHRNLGDIAECLRHSVLAVETLDDTATVHMRIWHRAKLADALTMSGSVEAARQRYRQCADLAAELDRPRLLMAMLNNWAHGELSNGYHVEAQDVAVKLVAHARAHDFELEPPMMDTIGAIQIENGRYAEAEGLLRLAIHRHGPSGMDDADTLADYHLTLARAQRGLAAYPDAQDSLDNGRRIAEQRGLSDILVRVHQEQAELLAAQGRFAEAFAEHKAFFEAFQQLRSRQREAEALTRQAMLETTEARAEAEQFREQARRDPLTGLYNRRYVDEHLPQLLAEEPDVIVAIADIDHFKNINDQLSHEVGDRVLAVVATLLKAEQLALSQDGFVARLGGEEFLLVIPGLPADAGFDALDAVRRSVGRHDWAGLTGGLPVTFSIGVAHADELPQPTQPELLAVADRRLYDAKRGGRDQVVAATAVTAGAL